VQRTGNGIAAFFSGGWSKRHWKLANLASFLASAWLWELVGEVDNVSYLNLYPTRPVACPLCHNAFSMLAQHLIADLDRLVLFGDGFNYLFSLHNAVNEGFVAANPEAGGRFHGDRHC